MDLRTALGPGTQYFFIITQEFKNGLNTAAVPSYLIVAFLTSSPLLYPPNPSSLVVMPNIARVDSRSTVVSSNASTTATTIWTKPATYGYKISELLSFPKRVISPPPAGLPMLATVGSLTLRPAYEVKIDDMLGMPR